MLKYAIALFLSANLLQAQDEPNRATAEVQIGDVLEIGKPETNRYKHINFPRANFIIKRGGIANYNSVEGNQVVVTSIKEKRDGTTKINIKRQDGGRFFGSHKYVTVDIKGALTDGELLTN